MPKEVRSLATRGAMYLYRGICPTIFASFPKSGRTWTKEVLESYFVSLAEVGGFDLDFDAWTPVLRVGKWRKAPGLIFHHGDYQSPRRLRTWIRRCHNRRILLQARDPRRVILSYYFQRIRRFGEAREMDFQTFLRDDVFGIRRIVEHLNLWLADRDHYRDFLLLRYETNVAEPIQQFERILDFLKAPKDRCKLAEAIHRVPDRTRNIEEGGLAVVDALRRGETDSPLSRGASRELQLAELGELLTEADTAYVEEQMQQLDPDLGYSNGR